MRKLLIIMSYFMFSSALAQTVTSLNNKLADPVMYLTGGYSSDQQMASSNQCLAVDPKNFSYVGNSVTITPLDQAEDFTQFQKDLAVDVITPGNYDMFSDEDPAKFVQAVVPTDYSVSFYYIGKIQLPTKVYTSTTQGLNALTAFGQEAEAADPTGQEFREACGDQYVSATALGAQVLLVYTLNFGSHHDRDTFENNMDQGVNHIATAIPSIQAIVAKYNLQGYLGISSIQIGGDSSKLLKAMGNADCGGHKCLPTCDFTDLTNCQILTNAIVDYTQTDFTTQLNYVDGQIVGQPADLNYTFSFYPNGVNVGQTVVTNSIKKARMALAAAYSEQQQQFLFSNNLVKSALIAKYLSPDYLSDFNEISKISEDNISLLEDNEAGAPLCYTQPTQCVKAAEEISKQIQPINQQLYNQFNTGYLASDQGYLYLVAPMGENQYKVFDAVTKQPVADETITVTENGIHIEGLTIASQHFSGDLTGHAAGAIYQGTVTYPDGPHNQSYASTLNPS